MIGLSGEGFGNWLVCAVIISILISFLVVYFANRRGINIESNRFQILLVSSLVLTLIFLPFWLTDLGIRWKLIITVVAILVGIGNYVFISRIQKTLSSISKNKHANKCSVKR